MRARSWPRPRRLGGASYALEITVEYAKARHQFGKALAEFQAISHYLADARTTLDGARLLVCEAAWAHSTGRPVDRLAPMAKLFACRTYRDITAMCQQVFGGIGFTLEYDIQLYFRRAKQLQLSWWDTTACEDRIAESWSTADHALPEWYRSWSTADHARRAADHALPGQSRSWSTAPTH